MVERTGCCADRTTDINIRVGMKSPPADGTGGDEEFIENKLCGIFTGPGQLGTASVLNCDGESSYLLMRQSSDICKCCCFRTKIWPLCNSAASELSFVRIQH